METPDQYFVFSIDEQRYAIALSSVERVIRAVELIVPPKAPDILLGLLNVQGGVIPVLNIRKRFNLPDRGIKLSDRIIIARTLRGTTAIVVDAAFGIIELPEEQILEAENILPEMGPHVEGVAKLADDMILIYDLDNLFPIQQMKKLEGVVEGEV